MLPTLLRHGLTSEAELDALIVECRRHLAESTTIQTSVIVIQAWGRKPSSSALRRASAHGLPPIH